MNKLLKAAFLSLLTFSVAVAAAQKEEVCYNPNLVKDTTKKSLKSVAEGKIGGASFTVHYHSPGVRKRIIWGGLVPFDEVWVTGAHDATTITFDRDVRIGSQTVKAGKYAFFTIPGEREWILILNKNYQQHLASQYDENEDVVRVKVTPQAAPHLERLQYFIEPTEGRDGKIAVAWEKVKVSLPVRVLE